MENLHIELDIDLDHEALAYASTVSGLQGEALYKEILTLGLRTLVQAKSPRLKPELIKKLLESDKKITKQPENYKKYENSEDLMSDVYQEAMKIREKKANKKAAF